MYYCYSDGSIAFIYVNSVRDVFLLEHTFHLTMKLSVFLIKNRKSIFIISISFYFFLRQLNLKVKEKMDVLSPLYNFICL